MKPLDSLLRLLAITLLLSSCIIVVDESGLGFHRGGLQGSGTRVEEQRDVGEFSAVELSVPAEVVVVVGEASSLSLSCDDNLLSLVRTEVRDGRLEITRPRGTSLRFRKGLEIRIATPSLSGFEVEGSGDVEIRGLHGERFEASIEGSGDIVAQGAVDFLEASIEGSGDMRLAGVQAREASVSIEGSGDIGVHVTDALRYRIEGSGDIRYEGSPNVSGGISGSGSVRQR